MQMWLLFLLGSLSLAASPAWAICQVNQASCIQVFPDGIIGKKGTLASIPANCVQGWTYFCTNCPAGQNIYGCSSTGNWTLESGGGGTGSPGGLNGNLQINSAGSFGAYGGTTCPTQCVQGLDANGTAVCVSCGGGGGTPGGADTNVQFNDSGAFGGDTKFAFNKTTGTATLGDATHVGTVNIEDGSGNHLKMTAISPLGFPVGAIFGSSASFAGAPRGLAISLVEGTTLGPVTAAFLNPLADTWDGPVSLFDFGGLNPPITLKDSAAAGSNANMVGFNFGGSFVVDDDSLGGPAISLFSFSSQFSNTPGVVKTLSQNAGIFNDNATFTADGAACTLTGVNSSLNSARVYATVNGGTLTVAEQKALKIQTQTQTGVHILEHTGVKYGGITGTGTVDYDAALDIDDGDVISGTGAHFSIESSGPLRRMAHHGPAVFGADMAPANTSVGLELNSITKAFLPSRMSSTQETALTPLDGMVLYNTNLPNGLPFRGRSNGTWVSFLTDDGAGNVKGKPSCDLFGTPTCGTGCSTVTASSGNCAGSLTTTTLATSAVLNFSGTRTAIPFCVCSDSSAASFCAVTSVSTSSVTFGLSAALTGTITYHCLLGA